jgi:uncharacterized protein YjiS (DUF1127 family)
MPLVKPANPTMVTVIHRSPNSRDKPELRAELARLSCRTISDYGQSRNDVLEARDPVRSLIEQPSSRDYHTLAAKARRLLADVTTPRLKQYLQQIITQSEKIGPRR